MDPPGELILLILPAHTDLRTSLYVVSVASACCAAATGTTGPVSSVIYFRATPVELGLTRRVAWCRHHTAIDLDYKTPIKSELGNTVSLCARKFSAHR